VRLSYRKKSMLLDNISRNSDTISPEIHFEYSWSYCDTAKWQLKLMQLNLTLNPKSRHQAYISNLQISNPFCQTTQHIFIRKNMTLYYKADSIAVWPLHRSRGEEQIRSCREQEREGRSEVGTSCVRIARQQRSHRAEERLQSRRGEVVEEKRRDHRSQNPWRLKRLKTIIINSQKTRAFLSFQDKKQGHIWLFRSSSLSGTSSMWFLPTLPQSTVLWLNTSSPPQHFVQRWTSNCVAHCRDCGCHHCYWLQRYGYTRWTEMHLD